MGSILEDGLWVRTWRKKVKDRGTWPGTDTALEALSTEGGTVLTPAQSFLVLSPLLLGKQLLVQPFGGVW